MRRTNEASFPVSLEPLGQVLLHLKSTLAGKGRVLKRRLFGSFRSLRPRISLSSSMSIVTLMMRRWKGSQNPRLVKPLRALYESRRASSNNSISRDVIPSTVPKYTIKNVVVLMSLKEEGGTAGAGAGDGHAAGPPFPLPLPPSPTEGGEPVGLRVPSSPFMLLLSALVETDGVKLRRGVRPGVMDTSIAGTGPGRSPGAQSQRPR